MAENTLSKLWNDYRHRFVPWLAGRIRSSRRREVTASTDKITSDEALKLVTEKITSNLHEELRKSIRIDSAAIMANTLGYCVRRARSSIRDAGTGVVLSTGSAQEGDFIAFYPGTLYRRFEPLFLPSIANHFILRCKDGIHIDGNNRFLSKTIYHSCVNRDSFGQYKAADISWLTEEPVSPWNIGQYVNNETTKFPANVAYQEFDIIDFPPELDYLLPNVWYSGSRGRHLRTVALIATRKINEGDEIFSNYLTIVHNSCKP